MNQSPANLQTCDVLGIGFGPSNIAFAIAAEEAQSALDIQYVEAAAAAAWQPGMLLAGSDVQNNALRDLVTPRNPRSYYSFTNYLKEVGRLFEYLNLGLAYPLRAEYAAYVEWVAGHFGDNVQYATHAADIAIDSASGTWSVDTSSGRINARALVLATGRNANIPAAFRSCLGDRVFHLTDYLPRIADLAVRGTLRSVTVIGASQSAVEINLDLLNRFPDLTVHSVHRSFSMRLKDTSPFSDHVYFPEYVDYFYGASAENRGRLKAESRGTNYSAADADVLQSLYVRSYEDRLQNRSRFHIHNNSHVEQASVDADGVDLTLHEYVRGNRENLRTDAVILATGFVDLSTESPIEGVPPVLSGVADLLTDDAGAFRICRDYRVESGDIPPLYLNGLCENTHGMGDAGSFSLVSLRSDEILQSLEQHFAAGSAK